MNGYASGRAVIIDNNYTAVKTVKTGGSLPPTDQHEFNMLNGGKTALITSYGPVQYDLSSENITGGQGWLLSPHFQEIDVATGDVLFTWTAADHVPITDSMVAPGSSDVSGDGKSYSTAWDYL